MKFNKIVLASLGLAAAVSSQGAWARDGVSVDEDGVTLKAFDGDLKLNLGGRVHLDGYSYDIEGESDTDVDFRRARLNLKGEIAGGLVGFRVEREFAGDDGWRNLYVSVRPHKMVEIRGGQMTVPFSMEDLQSTNSIPFAERSVANALSPGFGTGGQIAFAPGIGTLTVGYYGEALDDDGDGIQQGERFAARATLAPVRSRKLTVHLGAGYDGRTFGPAEELRLGARGGSLFTKRLIATPRLDGLSRADSFNGELAVLSGPFMVQGQYMVSSVKQEMDDTLHFAGGYVQAGWVVTGQRYNYSKRVGLVSGPKVGKRGPAVELVTRLGWLDLNTRNLDQGDITALDLGAVVHLTRNVRVMGNWTNSWYKDSTVDPDQHASVGTVRLQLAF